MATDLLADWQSSRSPKIADAIESLGVDSKWLRIGKLPGSRAKTAILNLSKIQDPRIATLYLTWLAQGNWPAPTAKVVWERVFAHLVALRDVRAIEPLRAVAKQLPPFVGEAHRAWMTTAITATADTLAKVKPTKDARHAPAKVKPTKPVADPAAPVWADPDDLELRRVTADALLERGDPWGELITLQLLANPNAAQKRRINALLAEHATTWLGPIAKLTLDGSWRFEHGFPIAVALDRRAVPRREWEAALAAPQWATIRSVAISLLTTPKWGVTAWVASPANRATTFAIGSIKDRGLTIERRGTDWQLVRATRGAASVYVPIVKAFVAGLPRGQPLTLAPDLQNHAAYAAAVRS